MLHYLSREADLLITYSLELGSSEQDKVQVGTQVTVQVAVQVTVQVAVQVAVQVGSIERIFSSISCLIRA